MANPPREGLWQRLVERRVPQYLGLYLGASWGVLEFTGFLTDRYALSPHLIDLFLLILGTMAPSFVVFIYTHGRPGKDVWTTFEKVFIPSNVVLTFGLILTLFSGKELGAATRVVTAEDETGSQVQRVIPKSKFRKKIALFFFANDTGQNSNEWAALWLPMGLYYDLIQDFYFDNRSPLHISEKIAESGVGTSGTNLPVALMREIAREIHMPYFLEGRIVGMDPYEVAIQLYSTKSGRVLQTHSYSDLMINAIIDRITSDLKVDLELPEGYLNDVEDLPIAALSSKDTTALSSYILGLRHIYFKRNLPEAARNLEKAVQADPTFAMAHYYLYQARLLLGEDANMNIEAAMKHIYKVPDRLRGAIKEIFYIWNNEPEKALTALSLDVSLFPDDVIARRRLAGFYLKMGHYAEALEQYRLIQSLNPDHEMVLRDIAGVYSSMGQFSEALKHLEDFRRSNPRDSQVLVDMGEIYQLLGRIDEAREVYERANLLNHNPTRVLLKLADLLVQTGDFDQGLEKQQEALRLAETSQLRLMVLHAREAVYESLGRIKDAMTVAHRAMPIERQIYGPMNSVLLRLQHFNKFAKTSLADSAMSIIASHEITLPDPWGRALSLLNVFYVLEQKEGLIDEESAAAVNAFYEDYKLLIDTPHEMILAGMAEHNHNYRDAIRFYIETLTHYPRRLMIQKDIARCYRKMGDHEAAYTSLSGLYAVYPYDPALLYELYQIQQAMNEAEATDTLGKLNAIWVDADDSFLPAQDAKRWQRERSS